MELNEKQKTVLLKGINASRVASRRGGGGKSLSYLEAWDVKAHMNRIFGFGNWSWDVLSADLAYAFGPTDGQRNHQVGYRVIGRLTIHATGATYSEAAVGMANLPDAGEAHDMAVKTAESDAFKRAAINLGDQFGLSLYKNGSTAPVVVQTLDGGDLVEVAVEVEEEPVIADGPVDPAVEQYVTDLRAAAVEGNIASIVEITAAISKAGLSESIYDGKTLAKIADLAVVHAGKVVSA